MTRRDSMKYEEVAKLAAELDVAQPKDIPIHQWLHPSKLTELIVKIFKDAVKTR